MSEEKKALTVEDIMKIMELIQEAYKESGRTVETATLLQGDNDPMVIYDNKNKEIH